jgi:hypothetical protein
MIKCIRIIIKLLILNLVVIAAMWFTSFLISSIEITVWDSTFLDFVYGPSFLVMLIPAIVALFYSLILNKIIYGQKRWLIITSSIILRNTTTSFIANKVNGLYFFILNSIFIFFKVFI